MSKNPNYDDVVVGVLNRLCERKEEVDFQSAYGTLLDEYYPVYFVQDDFTVATLVNTKTKVTEFCGVSKRDARDPKVPIRGKSLALSRAIRSFVAKRAMKKDEDVVQEVTMDQFISQDNRLAKA